MSSTTMTSANSLTVKLWEKKAWLQAMQRSALGHMFNRGAIYFPEKGLTKSAGDQFTFPYVGKLTGVPIGEGGTADGNEEALDLTSHSMVMNVSRIPVLNPNDDTIEQQRTNVQFEENTRKQLSMRCVELMDTSLFYHLAGAAPTTLTINGTTYDTTAKKLHVQGHNTPVAPTTNRILRAGAAANDQSLSSSNKMTLDLVDYALELSERSDQPLEGLDGDTFDLFVSPEQLVDLQHDAAGKVQWYNIELAKIQGGSENTIENRFKNGMICAGKYRNVYIYSMPRVAYGLRSDTSAVITTVRRAVLVGSNAVSFASPYGGRVTDKDVPMKLFVQMKDYDYYKGVEARLIYGLKKMSPTDKEDIGTIVLSTYAAAHT
ncbi:MAG: DUF4043 family protein [Pseudomonadota bacterium]|nr:DUF4043 family protein [Pseudomonadota bacterium]